MSARLVALKSNGDRIIVDEFANGVNFKVVDGQWVFTDDGKLIAIYSPHNILGLEFIDD